MQQSPIRYGLHLDGPPDIDTLACTCGALSFSQTQAHSFPVLSNLASVQVIQAKTDAKHGYTALQLGIGSKREKRMPAKERGHFVAAGMPLKRKLAEFRVWPGR